MSRPSPLAIERAGWLVVWKVVVTSNRGLTRRRRRISSSFWSRQMPFSWTKATHRNASSPSESTSHTA